ncbi:ankyrin [Hyaloscypha variabilis F]|uniref:Ankyrin n=1 Tax=Hyaloscypha variabilis (strain UAMH 11265 / GT02V1 / F) TaxID=1149755 RepID=A0A2J6QWH8_HYAVF|nr:ankyrin [Hyaloscypha variabilis F]
MPQDLLPNKTPNWHEHKDVILELRAANEPLVGDEGIIETMKRNYNFSATKSQYESQFRKWKCRKNLGRDEWPTVFKAIDQRRNQEKASHVYIAGRRVEKETLRRMRRRYPTTLPSNSPFHSRGSNSPIPPFPITCTMTTTSLPDGVEIKTPPQFHSPAFVPYGDQDIQSIDVNGEMFASLGTSQLFTAGVEDILTQPFHVPKDYTAVAENSYLDVAAAFTNVSYGNAPYPSAHVPDSTNYLDYTNVMPRDFVDVLNDAATIFGVARPANDHFLTDKASPSSELCIVNTQSSIHGMCDAITMMSKRLSRALLGWSMSEHTTQQTWLEGMPFLHREGIPSFESAARISADWMNFALGNSKPYTELEKPRNHLAEQLLEIAMSDIPQCASDLLQNSLSTTRNLITNLVSLLPRESVPLFAPRIVGKALTESLVKAAIEDYNIFVLDAVLTTGLITPNDIICVVDGVRYTAVERAVMLRQMDALKMLLKAGANVNKTHTFSKKECGALALVFAEDWKQWESFSEFANIPSKEHGWSNWRQWRRADPALIATLLDNRATVDVTNIYAAVESGDNESVLTFMPRLSDSQYQALYGNLSNAVLFLDNETSLRVVIQIVDGAARFLPAGDLSSSRYYSSTRQHIMRSAALVGNLELVKFLASNTSLEGGAVACALRGGHKTIVEFLMKRGIRPNGSAEKVTETFKYPKVYSTALSEAIRCKDDNLIRELEKRGAFAYFKVRDHFEAALYAASEVGNIPYVQKLLSTQRIYHQALPESLNTALSVSTKNGHRDIIMILLNAGANVSCASKRSGLSDARWDNDPLLEALRKKDKCVVEEILESDVYLGRASEELMEAAINWGDEFTIKHIVQMAEPDGSPILKPIIASGRKDILQFMVNELGADLGDYSERRRRKSTSPISLSVQSHNLDMVVCLLELGQSPADSEALCEAIKQDRESLVLLLQAFRSRFPTGKKGFGSIVLKEAIKTKDEGLLEMLLEANFDVNSMSPGFRHGSTAFGYALQQHDNGNLDRIRKLLDAGGDPNGIALAHGGNDSTVWPQETALLIAISTKDLDLVQLLIDRGAEINRPARQGLKRTPLQCASEVGSIEIVNLLISRDVDVNEAPAVRGGGTALQLCAIGGYVGIALKLLSRGANVHAAPSTLNGTGAIEGAAENGRLDMVKLLWNAARDVGEPFSPQSCNKAMRVAERNGHFACREYLKALIRAEQFSPTWNPLDGLIEQPEEVISQSEE